MESHKDKIARVQGMASGVNDTWDLSDNDVAALRTVLKDRADLLEMCRKAKKYLEPDLVEPGRTLFWALVDVIHGAGDRDA